MLSESETFCLEVVTCSPRVFFASKKSRGEISGFIRRRIYTYRSSLSFLINEMSIWVGSFFSCVDWGLMSRRESFALPQVVYIYTITWLGEGRE